MPEWFEVFFDELWSELFDRALGPPQLEERARAIQQLLAVGEGDAVLDVPCGLGRLSVPLARLGLRMTGVDLSPAYLDEGRDRAAAAGLAIRFIQSDMREIGFQGEFDAAFNWGGSFGYFSEADNLRYCKRVCEALKPGGRFLIEAANQAWLADNCHPRTELVACGVRLRQVSRYDRRSGRYRAIWTYATGNTKRRRRLSMRIYDPDELRELLHRAGFRQVHFHGGPPPIVPLDASSRRMIAVATRRAPDA